MNLNYKLLVISQLFVHFAYSQNERTLDFYLKQAHQNNPSLKENQYDQQLNLLQNDLTRAQFLKPQVNVTSDYLFSPYFNNNGNLITTSPETKAIGYDVGQTNGGLYATQINVEVPLLNAGIVKSLTNQNAVQYQLLLNNNKLLMHELDKSVIDFYIAAYQLQQQQYYLDRIIALIAERKKIVEALIQKALMQQSDYLLLEIEIISNQNELQQKKIALSAAFQQLNNVCGINDTLIYGLTIPELEQTATVEKYNFHEKFQLDSLNIVTQQLVSNTRYKPQLNIFGNTGLLASDAAQIPHNVGLSAGLHLNIPVYDGGQKQIIEQQSKLRLQALQKYEDNSTIQLQNNLNALQQQIILTTQSIETISAQLQKQETLLAILKDKVITGQMSVTDYLLVVENYIQSNQNKIQSQTNLWLLINQYNYINW